MFAPKSSRDLLPLGVSRAWASPVWIGHVFAIHRWHLRLGTRASRGRLGFRAPLLTLGALAVGCLPALLQAAGASQVGQAPAAEAGSGPGVLLEFELPEGDAGAGVDEVTAVRVGYFEGRGTRVFRSFDVALEALPIEGRTARIRLPLDGVVEGTQVRVRTVSDRGLSPWSQPVAMPGPPYVLPAPEAGPGTPGERAAATLGPADLERYPQLLAMLREVLPAEADPEEELSRFVDVEELAMALIIARGHGIPFTTIARAAEGPPRQRVRNAVRRLRPDLPGSVTRSAAAEVERLLAP
jgi:hypothetical protein